MQLGHKEAARALRVLGNKHILYNIFVCAFIWQETLRTIIVNIIKIDNRIAGCKTSMSHKIFTAGRCCIKEIIDLA